MKILLMMPCDEKSVHWATAIYKHLPKEVQEVTFCAPMFMEYLVTTKFADSGTSALFQTMLSIRATYDTAEKNALDLIVIGNTDKTKKFDAVFNFQDDEVSLPYEDLFIQKTKEVVADPAPELLTYIDNLHTADESLLKMRNSQATAKFLSAYLKTKIKHDAKLDEAIAALKESSSKWWN